MRFWMALIVVLAVGVGIGTGVALTYKPQLEPELEFVEPPKLGPGDPRIPPAPPADGPQPVCEVDNETYNFGTMEQNEELSHSFVFRNAGQYPLKLVKGDTTCKCTMSALEGSDVAPGETCDVTLTWVGKSDNPSFRQQATIFTNDPQRPSVILNVEGRILNSVGFQPPIVAFSGMLSQEEQTQDLLVWTTRPDDFQIKQLSFVEGSPAEYFAATAEPATVEAVQTFGGRNGWRIRVTVKPGLPAGDFQQVLLVEHTLEKVPPMRVPVAGQIVGNLSILGPQLTPLGTSRGIVQLGIIEKGKGRKHTLKIWLRGADREGVEFKVAHQKPEQLRVSFGPGKPLEQAQVTEVPLIIEVPPDCPTMHFMGGQTDGGSLREEMYGQVIIEANRPELGRIGLLVKFAVGG